MVSLWRVQQQVRNFYKAAGSWKDVLNNPFYDKYKKKLERIQGHCGVTVKEANNVLQSDSAIPSKYRRLVSGSALPTLTQVMKTELLLNKSSEEIGKIWVDYHKTKDCISAVMPGSTFLQLDAKASHCPMFVYPLPHEEGYEMWFAQFDSYRCYFTSLINYQRFQENAPISFTLTHYTDFLESKGIVLVHGEVNTNDLSLLGAQNLTNQMQLYYTSQKPEMYALLHQFNHNPEHFDYKVLIDTLNSISL